MPDAPRLDGRTFGWAAACAAATVPLVVLVVFHGDLSSALVADREGEEVLWIIWRLQATFHQIHHDDGLLPALKYALLDGYPYFGNVLHFWLLSVPLRALLPFPLWFNVNALAVDALDAFGAALLALTLTRSRAAGLLAAVAMALNPYTLMVLQRGRHRDALFVFVALFLAALVKAAATDRPRDHARCGLMLALAGLFYWFHALFGALCAALWTALRALSPRGLALVVGVAILVCAPFATPFYGKGRNSWQQYPYLTPLPSYGEAMQMPPGTSWRGIDEQSLRLIELDAMSAEWLIGGAARGAQPIALLLLALAGAWMAPRRALPWIVTALVFYVVGLGPNLKLHENPWPPDDPLPLPYRQLFRLVPFLSRLYHPRYASLLTLYSLLALAALAVAAAPTRRLRTAICGLGSLSILVSAALASPLATVTIEVPTFYATLPARAPGALVELPCYRDSGRDAGRSFYETLHDRPVVGTLGGYGREIPWDPRLVPTQTLFINDNLPSNPQIEDLRADWRTLGARWLVLHQAGGLAHPVLYDTLTHTLTSCLGPPAWEERERLPFGPEGAPPTLLRVWDLGPTPTP